MFKENMFKERPFTYIFSNTEIQDFVDEPERKLLFSDLVTLIVDTNFQLKNSLTNYNLTISKVDKDNNIIHEQTLTFPYDDTSSNTFFEDMLEPFTNTKAVKSKTGSPQVAKRIPKVATPKEQSTSANLGKLPILISISMVISILSLGLSIWQTIKVSGLNQENIALSKQVSTLKGDTNDTTDNNENKIDTFARFFLSAYFSEISDDKEFKKTISTYVKDIKQDWKPTKMAARSIFEYEFKRVKKNSYEITYLVFLRKNDKENVLKKVTTTINMTNDKPLVVAVPTVTDFNF